MTNNQINDIKGLASFARNIGKLRVGRATRFRSSLGTRYGKITCDTIGCRPRLFSVGGSEVIPNGSGYTYSKIMENLFDTVIQ